MNKSECRLLRERLTAKYKSDMAALDRVEEMLSENSDIDSVNGVVPETEHRPHVIGKELTKAVNEAIDSFAGEFTISEVCQKIESSGIHALKPNVINRIKEAEMKGKLVCIGKRDVQTGSKPNLYQKVTDALPAE